MNATQMMLWSLMESQAPTPPIARIIHAADELPADLRMRVSRGDLTPFEWRAWRSANDFAFMAAMRIASGRGHELLQVVAIGADGEHGGQWQRRGHGALQPIAARS
jgi:hypothetical protein